MRLPIAITMMSACLVSARCRASGCADVTVAFARPLLHQHQGERLADDIAPATITTCCPSILI